MIDLRNQCVHPASKKAYITASSGGKQSSTEDNKVSAVFHFRSHAAFVCVCVCVCCFVVWYGAAG